MQKSRLIVPSTAFTTISKATSFLQKGSAVLVAAGVFASGAAYSASAQDYPQRPIKLVVPSVPGSSPDTLARLLAEPLSAGLGQKVVVENKPGAGGVIAMENVARAAPDGYVLAIAHDGNMAINTVVYKQLSYSPTQDFTAISLLGFNEFVLVAHPSLNIKTFEEFVAYAKAKKGIATYGSAGVGSPNHLFMEQVMQAAGVELSHVPYKGGPASMQGLLGGQIDFMMVGLAPAIPHITGGKLTALAVPQATRAKLLPDTPTISEKIPGVTTRTWFGLFGPAKMDPKVVEILNKQIQQVLSDPKTQERIAVQGMVAQSSSPAALSTMITEDIKRYQALAAEIKLEAN
jgi:tripartite-type tricarboxylate transporter receptor subunit TctC